MKTKIWILTITALIVTVITTVSFTVSHNKTSRDKIITKDTVITGQELFRLNCASCHGIDSNGNLPTFPSLANTKEKLTKDEIKMIVKNGKGTMPSLAHLSDNEINAITAFLFNEPNQQTAIINYSSVDLGKNIVLSNCVSCHRLSINDSLSPNANTKCSMMEPATFSGTTKKFTKEEFYDILQTGICYMPSFDFLTAQDNDAIWAYLETLESNDDEPEAKQWGQMCPMMKRCKSCCCMH